MVDWQVWACSIQHPCPIDIQYTALPVSTHGIDVCLLACLSDDLQKENEARSVGTGNCLDGYWLALIQGFFCEPTGWVGCIHWFEICLRGGYNMLTSGRACSTAPCVGITYWLLQAFCGISLYYTNGFDVREEIVGRKSTSVLGECSFDVNEPVLSGVRGCMHDLSGGAAVGIASPHSAMHTFIQMPTCPSFMENEPKLQHDHNFPFLGTIWDNDRCPGTDCRLGKLEL